MRNAAAGALVFATSAAVLVLEILAGRLLAPYVGLTLESTTGIIGVVLAAISLGTWAGGRLADGVDPRSTIGPLLMGGGAASLLVVPIVRLLGPAAGGSAASIVVVAAGAFFLPAALLSAVAPAVVKMQVRDLATTGATVGRLSALGTAGAIVGTFVTGFLLVASSPVRLVVTGLGVLTIVGGAVLTVLLGRRPPGGTAALALAIGMAGSGLAAVVPERCPDKSVYFCARVERDPDRPTGRILRLDTLRHSYVDLADPTHLEFGYTRSLAAVIDGASPGPVAALHIGGGGFTMPRWLAATRPGSTSVVLELDPALVDLARRELGLRTGPDLRVVEGDGRLGIADQPAQAFDVVVGDAFGSLAVPWHLATRELVADVQRVLRPGGIYLLNVIDYPPQRFVKAEAATLAAVFAHVALVAPGKGVAGEVGGNHVLVASDAPIDVAGLDPRLRDRDDPQVAVSGPELERFVGDAGVLSDDFAPVDQLLTRP
jgi:SAM-dependent methyltransferase